MKPSQMKAMFNKNVYKVVPIVPQVATIKGVAKLHSENYSKAYLVLYDSKDHLPIQFIQPDDSGNFIFKDLNINLNTYIVAFDKNGKMNAIIQDNVIPK